MNMLTRRLALRAIGAALPMAAMADAHDRQMLTNPGLANRNNGAPNAPAGNALRFTDFAMWFSDVGHREIKNDARWVSGFDGDIIDMHLPMATKVRMQRQRNYERLLAERKRWFAEQIGVAGFVEWWR